MGSKLDSSSVGSKQDGRTTLKAVGCGRWKPAVPYTIEEAACVPGRDLNRRRRGSCCCISCSCAMPQDGVTPDGCCMHAGKNCLHQLQCGYTVPRSHSPVLALPASVPPPPQTSVLNMGPFSRVNKLATFIAAHGPQLDASSPCDGVWHKPP